MRPRAVVENVKNVIIHTAGEYVDGAVDVFAAPGNRVHAPGDGWIVQRMQLHAPLFGWQLRGYMVQADGERVGFVVAHLRGDSLIKTQRFVKGDVLGVVAPWPQHPNSSHAHWSFRKGGGMPPPGNCLVAEAFRDFGDKTW